MYEPTYEWFKTVVSSLRLYSPKLSKQITRVHLSMQNKIGLLGPLILLIISMPKTKQSTIAFHNLVNTVKNKTE